MPATRTPESVSSLCVIGTVHGKRDNARRTDGFTAVFGSTDSFLRTFADSLAVLELGTSV